MLVGEASVSGDLAAATTATATATATVAAREAENEGGGEAAGSIFGSSNSGEDDKSRVLDEAERCFGGNRWPRQETLALLKIRSDMDVAFRDASVKGPLWEEISRKLGELGYHRSAKKCKEKFENVFKYHKRTKDSRSSKGQGKTYRFFDQLEAFEHHHPPQLQSPSLKPHQASVSAAAVSVAMPAANNPPSSTTIVPSTTTQHITVPHLTNLTSSGAIPSFPSAAATNPTNLPPPQATTNYPSQSNIPSSFHNISPDLPSNSTSSSTSSDLELEGRRNRKRKWRDFFERLMKQVVEKQEELQMKLLEAIEKREHERMVREEAWRLQEMTRINREREILAQERSIASAKDAAVMAFLQKLAEQQNPGGQVVISTSNNSIPPPPIILPPVPAPAPVQSQPPPLQPTSTPAPAPPLPRPHQQQPVFSIERTKTDNGGERSNYTGGTSSSRWPKIEVEALIKMRTSLDSKYQENGPKGPLWEEISAGMRKLGYNRSSKRCKEKWENINKYFKKVKESHKKRPEDSKTCPYFHQLDALYKERNKLETSSSVLSNQLIKPENSVPLMVRPEQQWPPQPEHQQDDQAMEDIESDQNVEEDDKDGDDDEEEDDGGGFEIVPNNKPVNSMDANE